MNSSKLTHPTYQIVDQESQADALAWVFTNEKDPMTKIAFKFPLIQTDEVRAKITYTGLCHSDLHCVRVDWGPCGYPNPISPGHEVVGVVTHIGSDVKDFQIGDKVGFGCQRASCDNCELCTQNCERLCRQVSNKFTYDNKYWGGYATSLQQPAKFYFKVPSNLPEERVPPLFCAGVTTYTPIAKYAKPGQEVAVLGIGGLGHMAVQFAKAWGCKVTAFTSSKDKETFIKKLGADRVVVTTQENLKQEGGKFHLVINTLPVSENLQSYVNLTRALGTFCILGAPPVDKPLIMGAFPIIGGHINFTGSSIGSRKDIQDMLEFSSKYNILPLCEGFDFEDFPKAFNTLENGKPIFRCVVDVTKANPKY